MQPKSNPPHHQKFHKKFYRRHVQSISSLIVYARFPSIGGVGTKRRRPKIPCGIESVTPKLIWRALFLVPPTKNQRQIQERQQAQTDDHYIDTARNPQTPVNDQTSGRQERLEREKRDQEKREQERLERVKLQERLAQKGIRAGEIRTREAGIKEA
jgi:hypothetical protein